MSARAGDFGNAHKLLVACAWQTSARAFKQFAPPEDGGRRNNLRLFPSYRRLPRVGRPISPVYVRMCVSHRGPCLPHMRAGRRGQPQRQRQLLVADVVTPGWPSCYCEISQQQQQRQECAVGGSPDAAAAADAAAPAAAAVNMPCTYAALARKSILVYEAGNFAM